MRALFLLIALLLTMFVMLNASPVPSFRSSVVSTVLGPELDEIRQHLQIVPEIRNYMKDVVGVVHDIRNLLTKLPALDTLTKKSFISKAFTN